MLMLSCNLEGKSGEVLLIEGLKPVRVLKLCFSFIFAFLS